MASSTNRALSPSRSDPSAVGNQHGRQPSPASNTRSNSDERLQANSKPSPLAPPTSLHSSRSRGFQVGRSGPTSSNNSVVSSREASPIRPPPRTNHSTSTSRSASRSRHNSQEFSPTRSSSAISLHHPSIPSALSLQASLANANVPYLPPPSVDNDNMKPNKTAVSTKFDDPIRLSKSSRLMSAPSLSTSSSRNNPQSVGSSRRDQDVPAANTSSRRNQTGNLDEESQLNRQDSETEGNQSRFGSRNVGRSSNAPSPGLETVQEAGGPEILVTGNTPEPPMKDESADPKISRESGSDSGDNKSSTFQGENKTKGRPALSHQGDVNPKRSFTSLNTSRGKPGENSMTNMIVETETVSSVPQVALGAVGTERGASGRGPGGATIRLRPSDETIRPKKEKKKQARKPALPPGTASSKADIFEAKVASAVDDADSSDSEETFVYESNPPDPHPARQHRYHSRTPSAASAVSQLDHHYGGRSRSGLRDALHGISGKRSMKFTNSYNTFDGEGVDHAYGRGSSRSNGHLHSTRHHHHIGRHGRNGAHVSYSDQSSQGSKPSRHLTNNGNGHYRRFFKRDGDTYGFDFDAEGADDERTPLTGRNLRGRHGRRPNSSNIRQNDYMGHHRRGCFSRYGACALLLILLVIVSVGSTLFIIGVTKPLTDVSVNEIQNVLASEQEIMLDLDVQATNPNLFTLTINDLDVNIFAKSRYIGSESFAARSDGVQSQELPRTSTSRLRKRLSQNAKDVRSDDKQNNPVASPALNITGVDKGTDPMPDDPAGDPQTMLLGRVFRFDSPLIFEASPWRYISSNSTAQIRLKKPGNKTEEGGSERWERVLQHPFELIVRGVVKYQLPLSSGTRSSSISSKINVQPEDNGDNGDGDNDPENPTT